MPAVPLPPFLPGNSEEFATHTTDHSQEWYEYCRQAYDYINAAEAAIAEANERTTQSDLQLQALKQEVTHWKEKYDHLQTQNRAVRDYQDELIQKMQSQLVKAEEERNQAIRAAVPMVNTPISTPTPEPVAKKPADPAVGAPPSVAPPSSEASRLSERLPDPEKFEGDRKDLRRFVSQIHEKMNVNRDRFPSAQSRMTYVTNRLKGPPYAQILPYIHRGICQLTDYEEILDILDRAFGDPNRVNNARNDLFRLRQTNKDFGVFFAEFQRLALEGEMPEETLPTLLEQAINRELRSMLMHNEPPSRKYHEFAAFLQDLENRRRHYETPPVTTPTARTYAAASKPPAQPPAPRPTNPLAPARSTEETLRKASTTPQTGSDAMDLSLARRAQPTGRRERGECFRCGSTEHLVRDCPQPDTRPLRIRSMNRDLSPTRSSRSPSPDRDSAKGVSLA